MSTRSQLRAGHGHSNVERIMGSACHFKTLGLPRAAAVSPQTVRVEYRKQLISVHPDHCSHPSAANAFVKLQHAYEVGRARCCPDCSNAARCQRNLLFMTIYD